MTPPEPYANVYARNAVLGATANPAMPAPDAVDEAFVREANRVLLMAVETLRRLIGAHQAAVAIIVAGDWSSVRKMFSLSSKYADYSGYDTPATGYGTHGWMLRQDHAVRMTQAELEAHPEWKNFGRDAGKHPPMRGWMAAPIRDRSGVNWGLLQLSDKYEGDFTAEDEAAFVCFAGLVSGHLEALWEVRNLRKSGA